SKCRPGLTAGSQNNGGVSDERHNILSYQYKNNGRRPGFLQHRSAVPLRSGPAAGQVCCRRQVHIGNTQPETVQNDYIGCIQC
ncbi:MAG: hypothetical protein ACKOXV_04810, partial [Bacteroidota bacterium]